MDRTGESAEIRDGWGRADQQRQKRVCDTGGQWDSEKSNASNVSVHESATVKLNKCE